MKNKFFMFPFRLIISILILSFSYLLPNFTQDHKIRFEHLTSEEGLSHSYVRCILQDKEGFMWFGTFDGLNKFDGYNFTVYRNDYKDTGSITANIIYSLFEDSNGNLWIGTAEGLCLYHRDRNSFINYNKKNNYSTTNIDIRTIFEDSQNRLWIGTYGDGLFWLDRQKNMLIPYLKNKQDTNIIGNIIRNIFEDSKSNLWIASDNEGLILFNRFTKTFKQYKHQENNRNSIIGNDIYAIVEDIHGCLWFGCYKDGLSCIHLDELNKEIFINFQHDPKNSQSLSSNLISSLCADKNGGIWIGTEDGGLDFIQNNKKTFIHYINYESDPNSINNNSIYSLFQDKSGNLWIGTYSGGINLINYTKQAFKHFKNLPGNRNSLSNNFVMEFQEDHNGYIWIATDGGGLNKFDPETGKFEYYNSKNSNLNKDVLPTVFVDSQNNIWVGAWSGGFSLFDRRTKSFHTFTSENSNLSNNNVFDINEDRKGNLWIATQKGLNKFNKKAKSFTIYNEKNSDLIFNQIELIKEDNNGNILIGSFQGLSIFNPETEKFLNYTHNPENDNSISNNFITSIFEEDSIILWITTTNGLNKLNRKTNQITRYFKTNGLPNDLILGIEKDNNGCLWISTNGGLSKFDPKKETFKNYTKEDGLQGNTFIKKSHYKSSDGKLYFGGTNGFNVFNPNDIIENKAIPPIIITDFQIFNKPVKINAEGSPLKKHIDQTKEIILSYKQTVFSFEYVALNYTSSSKNQYAYMLEGFDPDPDNYRDGWNYVGTRRLATYTNINPGKYIFRVKGSNNDGIWNETGASIKITILPPWWKTIWFRIILALLIITGPITFYFIRINSLKKQQQFLEQKVKERTDELLQVNTMLEEKQEEVTMQNAQLKEKQEELTDANILLEESKEEIRLQNVQLANHRNNLEQLVKDRTNELEKAMKKVEESDRLKTAFLANMSHEIRTPMNAIVGFSSLLKSLDMSEEEKEKCIDAIDNNCEALLVLINDILEISLIEANQISISKTLFDVDLILKELVEFTNLKNDKKLKINFIRKNENQKLILNNDPTRFRQIMTNLLSNAYKYTDKGHIDFGYEILNNQVRFFVSDTGIGISEEEYKHIFDHFHKIENNKTKLYRGAGLGLSICKKLVELMGGEIWLESTPGKGTTFYFTMPFSDSIISYKSDPKEKIKLNVDLKDLKVLVAEDEPDNFDLIKKILISSKAEVIWAKNGQEAVDYIKNNSDIKNMLILMDIKMPVMNGIEALRLIRKINKNIPVIAVTAYAHDSDKSEILKNDFNDYIVKPLKPDFLLEIIKKYI